MKARLLALTALCLLIAAPVGAAPATPPTKVERARAHFEAGRGLYTLGRYGEALAEFTAGYAEVPKNHFLVNIGQCHRRLGNLGKAREAFQTFHDRVAPNDPDLPEIDALLREIDAELARLPTVAPMVAPPIAPAPITTAVVVTKPVIIAPRSGFRRHFWILPVVTVAAAGLAVGLYFGLRATSCNANLGCSDLRR